MYTSHVNTVALAESHRIYHVDWIGQVRDREVYHLYYKPIY